MKIIQLNDYDQIVKFINNADYHTASYLYKLPQAHENVETAIRQAIDDPGVFAQVDEQNEIVMLIFAFKYEDNKYKVIGPFIDKKSELTTESFKILFETMAQSKPDTANFNFSFEENEQNYSSFMKSIQSSYSFTDYHLISTDRKSVV